MIGKTLRKATIYQLLAWLKTETESTCGADSTSRNTASKRIRRIQDEIVRRVLVAGLGSASDAA